MKFRMLKVCFTSMPTEPILSVLQYLSRFLTQQFICVSYQVISGFSAAVVH